MSAGRNLIGSIFGSLRSTPVVEVPAWFEALEHRRLLSASAVFHERAGVSFTADLGKFITIAPGTGLVTSINWGDGKTSTGTLVGAGVVGLDELRFKLDASHTYTRAGRYAITATVTKPGIALTTNILLVASFSDNAIVARGDTHLGATINGTYSHVLDSSPDTGAEYQFTGSGAADALGLVSAVGEVRLPGNVLSGDATGTLKLTSISTAVNKAGSVTLKLTGPKEKGFGSFPKTLNFTISSGTGIYTGASGSGIVDATFGGPGGADAFSFVLSSLGPALARA